MCGVFIARKLIVRKIKNFKKLQNKTDWGLHFYESDFLGRQCNQKHLCSVV